MRDKEAELELWGNDGRVQRRRSYCRRPAEQLTRRRCNAPVRRPWRHLSRLFVHFSFGQSSELHFASERVAEQLDLWERYSLGRQPTSVTSRFSSWGTLAGLGARARRAEHY